jgi:eukaryotic-like serine/threonine-protein kinase
VRLQPGTRVGPYEVITLVGAGGMAEVYRARDTRLQRDVALKVMSEALGGDAALLERFEREARLAGSLNHPNVVALYDVGLQDGKPYFVTELLHGESLRERLTKGAVPLPTALEWAVQITQGLAAAHERGIAHRDLKPENIFITRDGHIKLLDFGIAKLVEGAHADASHGLMDETVSPSGARTGTGMVLGTPGYMSPEQVRGDTVDTRTDFFSLGSVLYEVLAGHRAFGSGSVVESGYSILHAEPEPLPASVPPSVAQVVRRCLEKDSERRFQSARDLAFYLDALRSPSSASGPTLAVPAPLARRWPRWLAPLGGAAALIGATTGAFFVGRDRRLPTPSVELITTRLGMASAARFDPIGRVVFSAAWEGKPLELFARAPGSVEQQPLGLADSALLGISPSGELAVALHPGAFGGQLKGTLAVVPEAGGKPRELLENVAWADFSPSGELAVIRFVNGRFQVEFPVGKVLYETVVLLRHPRVSPRGDAVAFLEGGQIKLVNSQGQQQTLASVDFPTGLAWTPNGTEVWFTAVSGSGSALWATSRRARKPRLVYQGMFPMRLDDISPSGRVLLGVEDDRLEIAFLAAGQQRELRLSVFDSTLAALSDDGRQVLFTSTEGPVVYLRQTDGSAPLKLGAGNALALSSDEKWALVQTGPGQGSLSLLPTGPGSPGTVSLAGVFPTGARWLHSGRDIVVNGIGLDGLRSELYLVPLDGGAPIAISDGGVVPLLLEVSSDDQWVAGLAPSEVLTLYRTDGGASLPLPELGKDAFPVGWTPAGELWVQLDALREFPSHLVRYDVVRHRRLEERTISVGDPTGVLSLFDMKVTPDGGAVAFGYRRTLGYLFLVDGLDAASH